MKLRVILAGLLVLIALALDCRPAEAQFFPSTGPRLSKGDAAAIIIGIAAVAAVITVGVVYAVRHKPSITGCAVSGPGGLTLENESDHQSFALNGDTTAIKPGDRVKVVGKKQNANGAARGFMVLKVKKDYGACPVTP
jgi:hypothetical protein